jgi:sugar phosphate isomerase/epimerase
MSYPQTGKEVFVSFSLSNTMFSGIGKGTITREEVSVDYLKELFAKYGVVVSAKPEQRKLLEAINDIYDLKLEIPENLKIIHLSEKNRRLVVISVQGLKRINGSLLPQYSEEEFREVTFSFVKYYVQSRHYDDLIAENAKLKRDLDVEIAWRTRECEI